MGHIRNSLLKLGLCSFFPSEIGFVLHFSYLAYRISYFVGARNRRRAVRPPILEGVARLMRKKASAIGGQGS